VVLENLRFHAEEEKNDPNFAAAVASLGDIYINDAFSCSHRAHASVAALPALLPHAAGRLMEQELRTLSSIFATSAHPLAALVGGAKISSKLALLDTLVDRVDLLLIGGAMAHTFLVAQGLEVGKSLYEPDLVKTASRILAHAKTNGCKLLLPVDAVVANEFSPRAASRIVPVTALPKNGMMLDVGPRTVALFADALVGCRTMVWNGPLGAFETPPFDVSTISLARHVASLTAEKKLESIAGGGDTVAALAYAGLSEGFSYLSTAGGAFLEWLEGKTLPGVEALTKK
jgi:phosphoglycerate kinase